MGSALRVKEPPELPVLVVAQLGGKGWAMPWAEEDLAVRPHAHGLVGVRRGRAARWLLEAEAVSRSAGEATCTRPALERKVPARCP